MSKTIIILGATGLFGGHLARQLLARGDFDVVAVGRSAAKLEALRTRHGGRMAVLDRADLSAVTKFLDLEKPFAVIDAAGPFQSYGEEPYAFAKAVISAGAHYIDIADGRDFVAGFTTLDALAQSRGVVALSGASSTPALSSAAVAQLSQGLTTVELIETAIVPGNRTERGLSVIRAILNGVGKPMPVWRGNRWHQARGWSDTQSVDIDIPGMPRMRRRAALVDTPDVALFPQRFRARTVLFRAGLELGLMHHALTVLGAAVARGWIRTLDPLATPLLRASRWFQRFGSDAGGMRVDVVGQTPDGARVARAWMLAATDGLGPKIPTQPVIVLLDKIRRGALKSGARTAIDAATLQEYEGALHALGIKTHETAAPAPTLFESVLGSEFTRLPPAIQALHRGFGPAVYRGRADIDGADGIIARAIAILMRFPAMTRDVPVSVAIDATPDRERWVRTFGTHTFHSTLTRDAAKNRILERFGPLTFTLNVHEDAGSLHYPVSSGRIFNIVPLPRWLLPISTTREYASGDGRFHFDVLISLRSGRRVVHYRGWLEPDTANDDPLSLPAISEPPSQYPPSTFSHSRT